MRRSAVTRWPAAAVIVACVALAAACSSGGKPAASPPASAPLSAPTASASAPPVSAQQAVISAYTAYFPASQKAETAATPAAAAKILAPYAAQPYLGDVVTGMTQYRAEGKVAWGYVITHVTRVTVHGANAQVSDCQDDSHAALASIRTGQELAGSAGSADTYLMASLTRAADGRWRLVSLSHVALSCQPGPLQSS